ncbi:MAG TPA: glycosyltransferase family 39 protein, partial [Gemmataceae bacterium]|nr:glycosyltransferase family 39 protein [Gemmataceae bacterium]
MNKPLLIIVVGAILVRLGLWMGFQSLDMLHDDEREYNTIAKNLVAAHGNPDGFAVTSGSPTSIRPPLYPYFLAGVYSVAGVEHFQAVRFLQALLSLLTLPILYRLGVEVYSQKVGTWLAGLYAFYPSLLGYNNLILTETLFTFLFVSTCYLLIHALQTHSLGWLMAGGLVMGLTALTRSVLWLFPPVLCLFLLFAWKGSFSHRILAIASFSVIFGIVLTPWAVRNSKLHQTLVIVDVMGGRNFMMGNYEYTPLYRSWDAVSIPVEDDRFWRNEVIRANPDGGMETEGKVDKLALRQGLKFVAAHPGQTAFRDLIKFFDFWGLERELPSAASHGYFGSIPKGGVIGLSVLIVGAYVVALFLGVFGMCMVPPSSRTVHLFLLLLMAYITGMHTLVFGHSRYHVPLMPVVLLYAAAAVVHLRMIWECRSL